MSKEFKLADPGEGLHEAEILEIHVAAGDTVEDGDTVLTVETDKASTDVPAPFSGTIREVKVAEGDTVEVGSVLMTYDEGDDRDQSKDQDQSQDQGEGEGEGEGEEGKQPDSDERKDDSDEDSGHETNRESDEASENGQDETADTDDAQPAREKNVEMGDIESGAEDDQSRGDETGKAESTSPEQSDDRENTDDEDSRSPVPAAPSTRRLAREKNVDLHDIEPSGEQGRVTAEDVEAAAETAASRRDRGGKGEGKKPSALIPGGGTATALPDFSRWGKTERLPLRSIRRATAQTMARAWGEIPHVYHQDIADVTELERFRREHEDAAETQGGKFTLTVLVMKALAAALKQFPRFNASLDVDSQEIVLKHYCHIGLAVATDRGLLVPVIRDVDRKNLIELSTEAADIARKTRNGEIGREDMQGGCMTVTNPGSMGGSSLTPLINPPQVAILGMAQARLEQVVQGDLDDYDITPRLRLPLILGFDHRVNDGADAARFVTHLIGTLADPESLLLDI